MLVMADYKFTFGQYVGSTRAFNTLAQQFQDTFNVELGYDNRGMLYVVIQDDNKANEEYVKHMHYYIKGYSTANKTIMYFPEMKFQ